MSIAKGHRCQKLLEDKDLRQAFEDVRNALHQQFEEIEPSKVDELRLIKERLHLLRSVEQNLWQAIQDGKLEEFNMQEQEGPHFLGDLKWQNNR